MALSKKFKVELEKALRKELKKYSIEYFKFEHEKIICAYLPILSDCRIKLGLHDIEIFIEAEKKRIDPAHNLIKTLIWLDENNSKDPVILLQVFDEAYVMEDKPQIEMCKFIHNKIHSYYKNFIYCPLNVSGLTACHEIPPSFPIKQVCARIAEVARKLVEGYKVRLKK